MSINLLDLAKTSLGPILVQKAGALFGLDESIANKAMGALMPTLLSGVLNKTSTAEGAKDLFNMVKSPDVDANIVQNLPNMLSSESGVHNLGTQGGKLLGSLFGDKADGLGEQVAKIAGVPEQATVGVKGMTALAAPALMGLLKGQVNAGNLDSKGMTRMLADQIPHLEKSLPAQVADWLGWGSVAGFFGGIGSKFSGLLGSTVGAVGDVVSGTVGTAGAVAGAVGGAAVAGGKSAWSFLKWLLPLLLLALAAWFVLTQLKSCSPEKPAVPAAKVETPAVVAPTPAPAAPAKFDANTAIGDAKTKYLEALKALEASGKCDAPALANALGLYVVNFKSGSAVLPAADVTELQKATPAMKLCAKDNVKLSVVGHTDNVGNAAANLKLSQARANSLKALFVKEGIAADLMTASGKGDAEPVADNNTEEGRFKNRRITYGAAQ